YPLDEPDYLQKNVDQLNKFAAQKVSVGRRLFEGKQLYVDLQEATDEEIGYIRWSMTNEGQMWLYLQNIDAAGVDLKKVKQPFTIKDKVGIGACIERNAGVYVDRHTRTTVERLYAAGDITGGAGFISSAPYAVVFGYEAGLQAAKQAAETDGPEPADESRTDRVIAKIDAITGSGGEHWRNVEQALQGVVTVFGRYPLSDGRIDGALTLIEKLRGDAELKAENPHELSRAFEVLSLFDAAEAIFRAAKHRKTNLGHFKRHPDENRKVYGERIVLDNDGNPVTDETRDVPATEFYALYKDSAGVYRFTVHRTGK
ncbi:MAG: hypothetical protein LBO81_06715, partial [Clostridiales Family XIII bacterium]|nr:hypothetical protein [Clostridiales Family XIII bacterium]